MRLRVAGVARRCGGEAGFGLVELMVAILLMGMMAAAAYTSVDAFTRAGKDTADRGDTLAEARSAIDRMARDLRAANPIDPVDPVSDYDTSVSFSVFCNVGTAGCTSDGFRPLTYRVVSNQVERVVGGTVGTLLGPIGGTSHPTALQRGAIVNGASTPVFTYYDADGEPLVTTGTGAQPATAFRDCARSVEVRLHVLTKSGDADSDVELTTRVDLRNFNEVSECAD